MILQVFGLWLPPPKGRFGTPMVATKSWYKKNITASCSARISDISRTSHLLSIITPTTSLNFLLYCSLINMPCMFNITILKHPPPLSCCPGLRNFLLWIRLSFLLLFSSSVPCPLLTLFLPGSGFGCTVLSSILICAPHWCAPTATVVPGFVGHRGPLPAFV